MITSCPVLLDNFCFSLADNPLFIIFVNGIQLLVKKGEDEGRQKYNVDVCLFTDVAKMIAPTLHFTKIMPSSQISTREFFFTDTLDSTKLKSSR